MSLPRRLRIALLLAPALTVVAVFFGAGVAQAVAQSLGYQPYLDGWQWSTDAYVDLWNDPAVRASFALTARVALLSTVLAAVLGVCLALLLRRLGRGRRWAAGLLQADLAVPHLVGALCMLLLLGQSGLLSRLTHGAGLTATPADFAGLTADGFGVAVIAEYVWKETPFIAVVALGALGRATAQLEGAAAVLGARPWQRMRHVTLPLLAPAVLAGSVLVLAFTAGSYEVPLLLGRPYPATLPVVAYQLYRDIDLTARPEAMAVAVVISALSLTVVAGYVALVARLARRSV